MDRAAYYVALEGVTRYGLANAVRSILQGSLSHGFFPSPPELRKQCDKAMEHHERMAEKIRRRERENEEFFRLHGNPEPKDDAGRRRVQELYRQFCSKYETHEEAKEIADIRARYGMTDEVLAGIKDLPLPPRMGGKSAA